MSWTFSGPQVKEVDAAEAKARLDAGSAVVVDVREAEELPDGYIAGSRHIPMGKLQTHADELLTEQEVIFVCHSGVRSAAATAAFARAGHARVYNLAGGMVAWEGRRLPVELPEGFQES